MDGRPVTRCFPFICEVSSLKLDRKSFISMKKRQFCVYVVLYGVWLSVFTASIGSADDDSSFCDQYLRDPAAQQLPEYALTHTNKSCIRMADGRPEGRQKSLTVGPQGPILLQDNNLLMGISLVNRKNIPIRVVHAKGAGAFGDFVVTNDITRYCKASIFSAVGKRTEVKARFSIAGPSLPGQSDAVRGIRGLAVKMCGEDGTWDFTGLNMPVFFINDGYKNPSLVHCLGRNPRTNMRDANMFWDFMAQNVESIYAVLLLYSPKGIPLNYRNMDSHAINTFKLVNATGHAVYCKFHLMSNQGSATLGVADARTLAGTDPDNYTRDLYDAIATGHFPSWTLYIQVMDLEQANDHADYVFDSTKIWPKDEFPYIEVGLVTLKQNPDNFFAFVDNMAFCPGRLCPGIEPSPDKLLQVRIFTYHDAQLYRLGTNYLQLPVNRCPEEITNYERDGHCPFFNQDGAPNYYPNSFNGPVPCDKGNILPFKVCDVVDRYDNDRENIYEQAQEFWASLSPDDQTYTINAIANSLSTAYNTIQENTLKVLAAVNETLENAVRERLQQTKANPTIFV